MGPKKPKPPPFKKRMVQRLMTAFPPPSEKRALNKGKRQFWRDLVEKLPRPFYRATVYEHMLRQYKKDVHMLRKEYLKDVTDQRQKAAQEKLKKEQEQAEERARREVIKAERRRKNVERHLAALEVDDAARVEQEKKAEEARKRTELTARSAKIYALEMLKAESQASWLTDPIAEVDEETFMKVSDCPGFWPVKTLREMEVDYRVAANYQARDNTPSIKTLSRKRVMGSKDLRFQPNLSPEAQRMKELEKVYHKGKMRKPRGEPGTEAAPDASIPRAAAQVIDEVAATP